MRGCVRGRARGWGGWPRGAGARGAARDAVREASAFLEEKVRKKPSPHWDVLLRWASSIEPSSSVRERSDSEIQRFGVGPWEDESPTCIDTAIKRPPAPPDASS